MIARRGFIGGLAAMAAGWTGGDPGTGRGRGIRGGLPGPRPDQQYRPIGPQGPVGSTNNFIKTRILVTYGTGETGIFQYSGTPANGNPPDMWSVPPGVTKDPYGNTLTVSRGLAVANYSGGVAQTGAWLNPASGTVQSIVSGAPETWHNAALNSGFASAGGSFAPAGYQYEPVGNGRVRLRGVIQLVSNQLTSRPLFNLPSIYLPAFEQQFVTVNNLTGYALGNPVITVTNAVNATVLLNPSGSTGNTVSLDGIVIELD